MSDNNIWTDHWDPADEDWSGGGVVSKRLPRAAEKPGFGATVYELDPGDFVVYHFHHGWEELLVVLRGEPTLRTPDGERRVAEGEAVHFPVGPNGSPGLKNETHPAAREPRGPTPSSAEGGEDPDLRQITAPTRTRS